ncbi:glycerol-3-phosphate acyltransferase [Clostridia bacterium]|nr:glycerol-3-phosphate acyltransferase [Clostridia bacterium]
MMIFLKCMLSMLLSYLIGSINVAVLLSKKLKKKDVRDWGSKNAGATNVTRIFGIKLGVIVLILDMAKGIIAIELGRLLCTKFGVAPSMSLDYLNLIAAIWGHCFPLFFGFRGGKAVATVAGGLLLLNPLVLSGIAFVFILLATITKNVGIGSVSAAVSLPPVYVGWAFLNDGFGWEFLFVCIISAIVIWRHVKGMSKENIKSIWTESTKRTGGN